MVKVSNQDLRRELEQMRKEGYSRLSAIETAAAVNEVHRANVEKRLGAIEDTLKWLVRLVIGAIIAAVLAYILQGGLNIA